MSTKAKIKTKVRYSSIIDTAKYMSMTQNHDKLEGTESLKSWYWSEVRKQTQFAQKAQDIYQWDISGKWWNNGIESITETLSIHVDKLEEESIKIDDWLQDTYQKFEAWFQDELGEKWDAANTSLDDHFTED